MIAGADPPSAPDLEMLGFAHRLGEVWRTEPRRAVRITTATYDRGKPAGADIPSQRGGARTGKGCRQIG